MKLLTKFLLCFMISFTLVQIPMMRNEAHAGMISTQDALVDMTRAEGEKNIQEFLGRSEVKTKLLELGFSSEDATKRLALLSDSEVKKLNQDIEKATVGGSVAGILVLVLVVILIIYFARRI